MTRTKFLSSALLLAVGVLFAVGSAGQQTPPAKAVHKAAKAAKPAKKAAAPTAQMGLEPRAIDILKAASARLAAAKSMAFTAVVFATESENGPALVVRQRVLPNRDPFSDAAVVLRDPTVQQMAFRYLNENGSWQDSWDADTENGLPRAVQVAITTVRQGRLEAMPPLTVALRAAAQ